MAARPALDDGARVAALPGALQAQDDSADEMLRIEHQREAADQLAIGNVITSMRRVSSIDWTLFFERVSLVEQLLRADPAGAYTLMDFSTRDRYRHSIEELSKRARRTETDVASRAIELAKIALHDEPYHDRRHHVGYYLNLRGRFRLSRTSATGRDCASGSRALRTGHPAVGYLGAIAAVTFLSVISLMVYAARRGATTPSWGSSRSSSCSVSELVISVLHLIVTALVPPRQLPKLAMRDGITPEHRTIVAVPAIVDSEPRLFRLLDDLEVRFLANRDAHLHFALLSDHPDAHVPSVEGEAALVDTAKRRIDELNGRHGAGRFFFFHRDRRWNPGEERWMGWERKRGKLTEFNRLLRGATDTSFSVCHGDLSVLRSVKYMITLDSDTQLPMEVGRRLVGTLAHPLNRPRFDVSAGRVTEGYGVLQPRMGGTPSAPTGRRSRRCSPATRRRSVHDRGVRYLSGPVRRGVSYVGKGIYDVDAFERRSAGPRARQRALEPRPVRRHLRTCGARARMCTWWMTSRVALRWPLRPASIAGYVGDWQLLRWLWADGPDGCTASGPKHASCESRRWKIVDNLRRSLLAPGLVVLVVTGWFTRPARCPRAVDGAGRAVLVFPACARLARSLVAPVHGGPAPPLVGSLGATTCATNARSARCVGHALRSIRAWAPGGCHLAHAVPAVCSQASARWLEWVSANQLRTRWPRSLAEVAGEWTAASIAVGLRGAR